MNTFCLLVTFYKINSLSNVEQIILVDQSERFVFKPMLYELLSGGMHY